MPIDAHYLRNSGISAAAARSPYSSAAARVGIQQTVFWSKHLCRWQAFDQSDFFRLRLLSRVQSFGASERAIVRELFPNSFSISFSQTADWRRFRDLWNNVAFCQSAAGEKEIERRSLGTTLELALSLAPKDWTLDSEL